VHREALEGMVKATQSDVSKQEFVISTATASAADVQMGNMCILATQALFNAKTAVTLMTKLDRKGQMRTEDFITGFAQFIYNR
jgi:hypothetical protein